MAARQGHAQNNAYSIVQPVPEPGRPVLDACLTNQQAWLVSSETQDATQGEVHIVKKVNPRQAYRIFPSLERINLNHHAPGWGYLCFGVTLPRLAECVYQMPNREKYERVAIKCLNKRVVEAALRAGSREDPYNEIYRMQTMGDNVHVLGCIEALQDETYIYIIMPYCENYSLLRLIPGGEGLPEAQARYYFQQILENLKYLRDHRICHRDVSPDNCMVYRGRVVFSDLARSFQLPPEASHVYGTNAHGKPPYQPPEVFLGLSYNAYGCDLWAAVVTFFNLLTGQMLYDVPFHTDIKFRYFILARGIARTPLNELINEILMELDETKRLPLTNITSKCLELSPEVLEVFDHVLKMAPNERWGLDDVASSSFMTI